MSGETYIKRYPGGFVDLPSQTTAIDSQFLNRVEATLLRLLGEDPAANEVGVWTPASDRLVYQLLKNANIDPAAAISKSKLDFGAGLSNADIAPGAAIGYSKLNLAGSIVNGDIAAAAAIARSKLNFGSGLVDADIAAAAAIQASKIAGIALPPAIGTSLPGSPTTGLEALLTDSLTVPTYTWRFVYDGAITDAYKWRCISPSPLISDTVNVGFASASYVDLLATTSIGTATMTIASPCVVTRAAHGLVAGDSVSFTTTGALPTGLSVATPYFVVNPTTNDFQLATIPGGTPIVTTGSQSGTHTLLRATAPLIVVPRAGIYQYRLAIADPASFSAQIAHAAVKQGSAATSDTDSVNPAAVSNNITGTRLKTVTLAANDILKVQAKVAGAAALVFDTVSLEVWPVRVS